MYTASGTLFCSRFDDVFWKLCIISWWNHADFIEYPLSILYLCTRLEELLVILLVIVFCLWLEAYIHRGLGYILCPEYAWYIVAHTCCQGTGLVTVIITWLVYLMRTIPHTKPLRVMRIVQIVSVNECTDGIQITCAILQVFVQERKLVCSQNGIQKIWIFLLVPWGSHYFSFQFVCICTIYTIPEQAHIIHVCTCLIAMLLQVECDVWIHSWSNVTIIGSGFWCRVLCIAEHRHRQTVCVCIVVTIVVFAWSKERHGCS